MRSSPAGAAIPARPARAVLPLAGTALEEVLRTGSSLLLKTDGLAKGARRIPGLRVAWEAGRRAMEETRAIVSTQGTKIIMTTALGDIRIVSSAYGELCDGYLVKPIDKSKLIALLDELRVGERGAA